MKSGIALFSAAISLVLFSSIVFAQLSVYVSNSNINLNSSESKTVDITVFNSGATDKFSLRVFPPFVTSGSGQVATTLDTTTATINSNQNMTFELTFSASACVADFSSNIFTVTASSILNPNLQANNSVKVTTLRRFPVCISKVSLSNDTLIPGDTLTVTTEINNPSDVAATPFDLIIMIMNSSDQQVFAPMTNHLDIIQAQSNKLITNSFTIPQSIGYGRFNVQLTLKNIQTSELSTQTVAFVVQQFENPVAQKNVKLGLLTQDVFLTARNDGNSVVNASTTESIPIFMKTFVSFINSPDSEQTVGNNVVYTWLFYNLQPGEERTVEYQINLWQIVLLGVILIIAVAYAFTYVFTIRIVKNHHLFGPVAETKEISITLEVKNRTRHVIHDVYVRDFLPSFATVVDKFDTLKPMLRKAAGGTEIIWKFDSLGSMDERVLRYRIRPTMEILGEIKLPRAMIRYSDGKKELRKVVSKSISIKV